MKLEKWALIAEIVGAFAIVVTLAILINETRQNTAATYAASYDLLSRDLADWRMALAGNPEMQESYLTWMVFAETPERGPRSPENSELQNDTAGLVADSLFLIYERAYLGREYGRLANDVWARYERATCSDFSRRIWPRVQTGLFTDGFREFVDACLTE